YAIKKSKELGQGVPLRIALNMAKTEGKWGKNLKGREDANRNVRPGSEGGGDIPKAKGKYKRDANMSLSEIVADAKKNLKGKLTKK
ncbi:unnamed protein product, partial [marine sediment metagenome]